MRTKICGVTTVGDALEAVDLGAALVGLNFYPPSPRYLEPAAAAELVAEVRRRRPESEASWVGVFVDASAEELARVAESARLDLLQLHGDEDPGEMGKLGADLRGRLIKVFRLRSADPSADGSGELREIREIRERIRQELERKMEPWRALGVWGFLVDTLHPRLYGGTGESWDFSAVAPLAECGERLLLAGGLTPHNVAAVLRDCRPWGIDLCSGVEREPGHKDPHLMRRLFEEIQDATNRPAT